MAVEQACCGCCPLLWGVRMISMCTMLMGFFSVLSVASSPAEPAKERERQLQEPVLQDLVYIHKVWACLKIIGLVFGYQGLQGLYSRDALKLKWLSCYYVLSFCLEVISLGFYIVNACQVLADLKPELDKAAQQSHHRPMTCAEVRQLLFMQGIAQCIMYYCFARAVWNLARIFSSLPPTTAWLGDFPADIEAPLLGGFDPSEQRPQRLQLGQQRLQLGLHPQQQQRQQQPTKFVPFSGRPHRLD